MAPVLSSLSEIGRFVDNASAIYLSGCAAEIPGFAQLEVFKHRKTPVDIRGIFLPGVNRQDYTALGESVFWRTFFMAPGIAGAPERLNYCLWRYRDILRHCKAAPADTAVVMLSEPDAEGYCSYGVTADYAPDVVAAAKTVVGVINRQMPYTFGVKGPHISKLDAVIAIDHPLIELPPPRASEDSTTGKVAEGVASLIGDGATLQLGVGKIPSSVVSRLSDRRNLKVVSGFFGESMMGLFAAGVLSPEQPVICGVALGSGNFYRWLERNPSVQFEPVAVTHNISSVARNNDFVAVNGALEVDLLGQVNSCVTPEGFYSGPGGLPEFVDIAMASEGGRSVIALPATGGKQKASQIVARLTGAVPTVSATDADTVVTEYGIAELRGKSITERVAAMIAIAAPEHREDLRRQAQGLY